MKYINKNKFRSARLFEKIKHKSKYENKFIHKDNFRNTRLFGKMMFFLIYSNDWAVRHSIVFRGYRLDKLINDPDPLVRDDAIKKKNETCTRI